MFKDNISKSLAIKDAEINDMREAYGSKVEELQNGLEQAQTEANIWKDKYEKLKARMQGMLEGE
jgi:adenine-specific DNA methylase